MISFYRKFVLLISFFTLFSYSVFSQDYCDSYGMNSYIGITSVNFNTINESGSANPAYTDNTRLSTDVNIGGKYPLSINITTGMNWIYTKAWIDWDQNMQFDNYEVYDFGASIDKSDEPSTGSPYAVLVPVWAKLGKTRMRVSSKYYSTPEPCDRYFTGEVEDYSINVLSGLPLVSLNTEKLTIEENGGTSKLTVSLNEPSTQNITVNLGFTGSALAARYTCADQVIINAGQTSAEITCAAINNNITDGDQTIAVDILSVVNANENGNQQEIITIIDDDIPPILSFSDISVDEGIGVAVFEVRLNKISSQDVSFDWITGEWEAISPDDFIDVPWTKATIPAGQLSVNLQVTIIDDLVQEDEERFFCDFNNAENAVFPDTRLICTIVGGENIKSIEVDKKVPEKDFTPEQLVKEVLVTGCLTASSIEYKGNADLGLGFFDAGESTYPLSSGIILSNGIVKNAEGPNLNIIDLEDDELGGFDFDENNRDSDLMTLAGTNWVYKQWWNEALQGWEYRWGWEKTYNDAQVLEFDFVPAGDKLEFHYIFASEEYPRFACSDYNDGFAFIISGPGIVPDPDLSGKNIALIPGTESQWVTINNVNGSSDDGSAVSCGSSEFFVDERNGSATSFNGRTKVLTAKADVIPCGEKYHIKLIVYDRSDDNVNSAVFLEANSFKSNEIQVDNMIDGVENGQDVMFEGCDGSFMRFLRNQDHDINLEVRFKMDIAGTASNEFGQPQDYVYTDASGAILNDGVFPKTIVIPSGQAYVDYYYKALGDSDVEGDETIIFRIDKCPCDNSDYYEKTVTIIDSPKIDGVASAAIHCIGAGNPIATLNVELSDGINTSNYLYSFDGGVTFETDNVKTIVSNLPDGSDLVGEKFVIVVKDLFSCSANTITRTTTIPAITPVSANAGPDRNMCQGAGIQLSATPAPYCEWSCSTAGIINYLSDINVPNPRIADDIPVGEYEFTFRVQDQQGASPTCSDDDKMILSVLGSPIIESVIADKYALCSKENTTLRASVSNMSVTYSWNPTDGLSSSNIANPIFLADALVEESRSYTLTVKSIEPGNTCASVANLNQAINIYPLPSVSLNTLSSNLCSNGSDGEIKLEVSGGSPNLALPLYHFSWSHNAAIDTDFVDGLSPNTYTVLVTDSKSCETSLDVEVVSIPKPKAIFFE